METILSIWTVVAMTIFVGIVVWAWSSKRKEEFDAASRLVLDPEERRAEPEAGRTDG